MRLYFIYILFLNLFAQQSESFFSTHFIGQHKSEIKEIMQSKYNNLKLNSSNINNRYNYLKYEDQVNEITVLFFLSDKDECKRIRLMSDYSNINDMINEMNTYYKKLNKNNWIYSHKNDDYAVSLEEGDWFFTITIKNIAEK